MKKIAKFEKVSFDNFYGALSEDLRTRAEELYSALKLPVRATTGSAGYDFFAPFGFALNPGETLTVPTGIRVKIDEGWVLKLYPRSGLGFKYRLQLNNTVGIIDSDYYHSENEGHIFCKLTNASLENKQLVLKQGDGFCQGIFVEFGITVDDATSGNRNGGFGSTNR